tara:strand:+ start:407 stop:1105 length:699 start_codon:yes stop_codon:yes gene_type:complete
MSKQMLIGIGILLVFGCADVSKEHQLESGCSEAPSGGSSSTVSSGGGGTDTSTPETCEYFSFQNVDGWSWVQSDYYGKPMSGGQIIKDGSYNPVGYFDSGRRDYKSELDSIAVIGGCPYFCGDPMYVSNIMVGSSDCQENIPSNYECNYFTAEMNPNTGVFDNLWFESSSSGVVNGGYFPSVFMDDDASQSTLPRELALYGYVIANHFEMTLNDGVAVVLANILKGPSGCSE